MLRACRRVLKRGGRIAYYNIFVAEELPEDRRRSVAREGNETVFTRATQTGLLRSAGFVDIEVQDVTPEYRRTQQALIEASARHERGLRAALGEVDFEGRQRSRRQTLQNIDDGALRRALFVARRP